MSAKRQHGVEPPPARTSSTAADNSLHTEEKLICSMSASRPSAATNIAATSDSDLDGPSCGDNAMTITTNRSVKQKNRSETLKWKAYSRLRFTEVQGIFK